MARPPSRDDVGRKLVFELREPVPQQKLAFLEALQLQLVRLASVAQRLDGGVEIAMLFAQPFNVSGQRIAFLLRELPVDHLRSASSASRRPCCASKAADYERAVRPAQDARPARRRPRSLHKTCDGLGCLTEALRAFGNSRQCYRRAQ